MMLSLDRNWWVSITSGVSTPKSGGVLTGVKFTVGVQVPHGSIV